MRAGLLRQPGGFEGFVPVQVSLREQELPVPDRPDRSPREVDLDPRMVGCSPGSEEHDDGLAVIGYVDDFLGLDGDVVEGLPYLITPVADPLVAVEGAPNREVRRHPDLDSLVAVSRVIRRLRITPRLGGATHPEAEC
jgi:hypothetical protein